MSFKPNTNLFISSSAVYFAPPVSEIVANSEQRDLSKYIDILVDAKNEVFKRVQDAKQKIEQASTQMAEAEKVITSSTKTTRQSKAKAN